MLPAVKLKLQANVTVTSYIYEFKKPFHSSSLQVERFWLQSDATVCVLAGLGLSCTHTGLERRLGHGGLWKTTGWALTIFLLAHMVHTNHR